MKTSQYNILIPYKGNIIVYNTLWNSFILVDSKNKLLDYISGKENVNDISSNVPSIIMQKNIVVEDSTDEKNQIRTLLTNNVYDEKEMEIIIMPTLGCNFRCWYCYETHDNRMEKMSSHDICNIVKYIEKKMEFSPLTKVISIRFFGGEPFLYFDEVIKPLLEDIEKVAIKYHVDYVASATTNASLIKPSYLKFMKSHNFKYLQITLDGNKERHNRIRFAHSGDNSYDVIVGNIKESISVGIRVTLRLNISEHTELDVKRLLADFDDVADKELIVFSIYKVWQSKEEVNAIVDKIVGEIRNSGFHCTSYYSTPSSLWSICYADKENEIVIKPGGYIYKCTARDFSQERVEGRLNEYGEIMWNKQHKKRQETSVFDNKACMNCKIMPICIGGCRQKHIEHNDNNTCIYHMDELSKVEYARKVFMDKLETLII